MARYRYKAVDQAGKTVKGLHDATNLTELEQHLKRNGLDLIIAKEEGHTPSFRLGKIQRAELITFFFNLEQLTRAGVPLLECLTDLRDTVAESGFRDIITSMAESIKGGKKLSQAMREYPDTFDRITISLIRAGEDSGRLVDVFKHLTEMLKWQDEMAAQTKNIMIYPAFVGSVILATIVFLLTYLVPQLAGLARSMGLEIPLQTKLLLAISDFFIRHWYALLLAPFVLYGGYRLALWLHPDLQYHVDNFKLHMWPTGPILRKIILARFANTFAMMYGSGIAVLDCLAISCEVVNNQVIQRSLQDVMNDIEAGRNLSQSFQKTGMFPPLVVRMLKVGEATGQLDQALLNVGYFYDRDVKDSIRKIQVLLEPIMTLLLGGLLGWVMLSVLSPIYDFISKVQL